MEKILLVEDDRGLNQGIAMALKNDALEFLSCFSLKQAEEEWQRNNIALILLDINLPDGNGLSFLENVKKEKKNVPVILLTAKDTEMDEVAGLLAGADDYVTKPFSLSVLRARVEVQLRKKKEGVILKEGSCRFDFERQIFECGNEKLELSQTEQKILYLLVKNQGNTVTREQLQSYVWGNEFFYVEDNSLSVAVNRLRSKMKDKGYIKTVYGIGYSFEVKC